MVRIQITDEISHSLRNLRKTANGNSNLSRIQGFSFGQNQMNHLERLGAIISTMGELLTHHHSLLQADIQRADTLIDNARSRDQDIARAMGSVQQ